MSYKLTIIASAAMIAASGAAIADDNYPTFTFGGFGTVGAAHSSEKNADFNASSTQATGAGRSDSVSFGVDSRIGGQVTANVTKELSAVLQVVSEQNHDKTWTPHVEWANVKYAFTPDFSVRLGRIALPGLMYSNSRKVGFTLPWVRPPVDFYRSEILTSNDGIDMTYRHHFGQVNNSTTVFYGRRTVDIPASGGLSSEDKVRLKDTMGVTNIVEFGATTLRAAYIQTNITIDSLAQLRSFPVPMIAALGELGYDKPSKEIVLGASYDPGQWFVLGELKKNRYELSGDYRAWYVTGGYRFGDFTPYATYSTTKPTTLSRIPGTVSNGQKSVSAGVRWDFMKNADFKLQYERLKADAGGTGTLTNFGPGYRPGGTTNVVSAVVDFVF